MKTKQTYFLIQWKSMDNSPIDRRAIHRYQGQLLDSDKDYVVVESPLEVKLRHGLTNHRITSPYITLMRTPGEDFELVTGLLFSEGIITKVQDIIQIRWTGENKLLVELSTAVPFSRDNQRRATFSNSSCGVCSKTNLEELEYVIPFPLGPGPMFEADDILTWPSLLQKSQKLFSDTGGSHAVGLIVENEIVAIAEDVGRHNAMDKLLGKALRDPTIDTIRAGTIVSSRASFELVQKALSAGIPMLVAVGAPTSLAIALAEAYDMTLIGFARSGHYNIYSGRQRIRVHVEGTEKI